MTKDKIEELKHRIKINGNLSDRIVEVDEEFEHRHDFVLNNIVIEIIEEIFGTLADEEKK